MAQTQLFANIAELSALNVFTFPSSRFTVLYVPLKVIVPKTNQLSCHSFTGDLCIFAFYAFLSTSIQPIPANFVCYRSHGTIYPTRDLCRSS